MLRWIEKDLEPKRVQDVGGREIFVHEKVLQESLTITDGDLEIVQWIDVPLVKESELVDGNSNA